MAGSLRDSWSKVSRAREHLQTLKDEIPAYVKAKPYHIVEEDDLELGWRAFRFFLVEPIAPRWADILGDFANNGRSALNFLANQLVILNGNTPTKKTEFPIFIDGAEFGRLDKKGNPTRMSGLSKLVGVSPTAITAIEQRQPYHRGNDAERDPLWLLHKISNTDKHRHPLVIATGLVNTGMGIGTPGTSAYIHDMSISAGGIERISPLENGTKIYRYRLVGTVTGNLGVQFNFTFHIAFPDGPPGFGGEIVRSMEGMIGAVEETLDFFGPWFTS